MTKLLIVLLAVVLGVWLWRSRRAEDRQERNASQRQPTPNTNQEPKAMVSCEVCGLHLPESDAVRGPQGQGIYCSAQHQRQATRA